MLRDVRRGIVESRGTLDGAVRASQHPPHCASTDQADRNPGDNRGGL